jgi:methionyl-tRNA synthetase
MHEKISSLFKDWGISFDNYTRTESSTHKRFIQEFYLKVYKNGYIFDQEDTQLYCTNCQRFLPDRFVLGVCPYCGYDKARGDQCENCGHLLEPTALINPKCAICGSTPIEKTSRHWYLDLRKLEPEITEYIMNNPNFDDVTRSHSLNYMKQGLKPRSITRDNKWGIPAPFPGSEGKTIYVWMEAVLGYISATIEYFEKKGNPDAWKEWWFNKDTKTLYFIGKDNIPFHAIILPGLLLATKDNYVLPWNVCSTEFLTYERKKFSKSQKHGIWIDQALKILPPDYWRYALLLNRPEGRDTDFSLEIFENIVNSHLNDTLGNFVHRVLHFTYSNFEGKVPHPENLNEYDKSALELINKTASVVADNLDAIRIRDAVNHSMDLARAGNKYFNDTEPWNTIKIEPQKAANTIYVSLNIVKALAVLMEPIIPFTAEKIWRMLNLKDDVHRNSWKQISQLLEPGHEIQKPIPLFKKVKLEELKRKLQQLLE